MLTLKIRVPYKLGNLEDVLKELKEQFDYVDEVMDIYIVDGSIEIYIENGRAPEKTYDLRLLEK